MMKLNADETIKNDEPSLPVKPNGRSRSVSSRHLIAQPILAFDDPLDNCSSHAGLEGSSRQATPSQSLTEGAALALAADSDCTKTSIVSVRHRADHDNYRLLTLCSVAIKHICRLSSSSDYEADVKFQAVFRMLRANGILRWKTKAMKNFLSVNPLFESAFARLFEQTTVGVLSQNSLVIPQLNFNPYDEVPNRLSLDSSPNWYQSNFEEQDRLGSGAFGVVHRAKNLTDGGLYAIKKIRLRRLDLTELHRVQREVATLCRLDHRNVVRYHASWTEILPKGAAFGARVTSLSGCENEAKGDSLSSSSGASESTTSSASAPTARTDSSTSSFAHYAAKKSAAFEVSDSMVVFRDDEKDANDSSSAKEYAEQFNSELSFATNGDSGRPSRQQQDPILGSKIDWQLNNGRWTAKLSDHWQQQHDEESATSARENSAAVSYRRVFSLEEGPRLSGRDSQHQQRQLMPLSRRAPLNRMMGLRDNELVLFIQMQLCDTNLQAHLDRRNSSTANGGLVIDDYENHDIFQQLLRGIEYIHGQGILHRDLKCSNVFLQLVESPEATRCRYRVRIGDFGLARSVVGPTDSRRADAPRLKMSTVGTASYQSPELRAGLQYDQKTDMFSLGVILFELYQPFSSGHERQRLLNSLRQRHELPDDLTLRYPQEADAIQRLTHPDPARRPQAAELLQTWRYSTNKSAAIDRLVDEVATLRRLLAEETKRRRNAERKLVHYATQDCVGLDSDDDRKDG